MAIPIEVTGLDCETRPLALELTDGRRVHTSLAVVTAGACYRRPIFPRLQEFEGRGIWYQRECAGKKKSPSSAEASPLAKRPSFSQVTPPPLPCWCAAPACPRVCRAI
jgi:hypothetical protein